MLNGLLNQINTLPKVGPSFEFAWEFIDFLNMDVESAQAAVRRLTDGAVYRVVRRLGERAGLRARPHGLRHAAITEALDRTGGDVRRVAQFSRHRSIQTVLRYDDARRDAAGDVARLVAG